MDLIENWYRRATTQPLSESTLIFNPFTQRNNNSSLIKQIHVGKSVGKTQQGLEKSDSMVSVTGASGPNVVDPIKRSVAEDSGIATNNESANEKPSSRKRSAREIAQLYEQLKRKWLTQIKKSTPDRIKEPPMDEFSFTEKEKAEGNYHKNLKQKL